jgi:hypothetical protein
MSKRLRRNHTPAFKAEAALTVLMPLGVASLAWIGWVMADHCPVDRAPPPRRLTDGRLSPTNFHHVDGRYPNGGAGNWTCGHAA